MLAGRFFGTGGVSAASRRRRLVRSRRCGVRRLLLIGRRRGVGCGRRLVLPRRRLNRGVGWALLLQRRSLGGIRRRRLVCSRYRGVCGLFLIARRCGVGRGRRGFLHGIGLCLGQLFQGRIKCLLCFLDALSAGLGFAQRLARRLDLRLGRGNRVNGFRRRLYHRGRLRFRRRARRGRCQKRDCRTGAKHGFQQVHR